MKLEEIDYYINHLTGEDGENAYFSLIDYAGDSTVTAHLITVYNKSQDNQLRHKILEVLKYYADPTSIPFLAEILTSEYWRLSLDALVAIGSKESLRVLRAADLSLIQAPQDWVEEAIEQLEEKLTNSSSPAKIRRKNEN